MSWVQWLKRVFGIEIETAAAQVPAGGGNYLSSELSGLP